MLDFRNSSHWPVVVQCIRCLSQADRVPAVQPTKVGTARRFCAKKEAVTFQSNYWSTISANLSYH